MVGVAVRVAVDVLVGGTEVLVAVAVGVFVAAGGGADVLVGAAVRVAVLAGAGGTGVLLGGTAGPLGVLEGCAWV